MVDNFSIIEPLLQWRSEDDFYFIQLLQRKKDHKTIKVNGTNNNARLVKAYYVTSLEHLEFIKPEIIEICKIFNVRASINLNRRMFSRLQLDFIKKLINQIENGTVNKAYKAYSAVAGSANHDNEKKWIVDIDAEDMPHLNFIREAIEQCESGGKPNIITEIPSKSGLHIITRPFNRAQFDEMLRLGYVAHLDIQTNNPTNLFIP